MLSAPLLPLELNLFQQVGFEGLEVPEKFHGILKALRIELESFRNFFVAGS